MITFDAVCKVIEAQKFMEELQEDNERFLKWLAKHGEVSENLKQEILNGKKLTQDEIFCVLENRSLNESRKI